MNPSHILSLDHGCARPHKVYNSFPPWLWAKASVKCNVCKRACGRKSMFNAISLNSFCSQYQARWHWQVKICYSSGVGPFVMILPPATRGHDSQFPRAASKQACLLCSVSRCQAPEHKECTWAYSLLMIIIIFLINDSVYLYKTKGISVINIVATV